MPILESWCESFFFFQAMQALYYIEKKCRPAEQYNTDDGHQWPPSPSMMKRSG